MRLACILGFLCFWTVFVFAHRTRNVYGFQRDILDSCSGEFNVTRQDYWGRDPSEIPENFKCFVKCLVTNMGFVDGAGRVNVTELIEKINTLGTHENTAATIEKCEEMGGDSSCESVANVFFCIRSELTRPPIH